MNEVSVNKLRQAMARAEATDLDELERMAHYADEIGRQAVQVALADPDRDQAEQERRDREDDCASLSMEVLMRWRQRVGRTKWTRSDGVAQHKIIEALRGVLGDE